MLQPGGDLDLPQEPVGAEDGGEFGPQHLDRDPAPVPEVARGVDPRHAAPAHLPLDRVAAGEGGAEAVERVVHRGPLRRMLEHIPLTDSRPRRRQTRWGRLLKTRKR